MAKERQKIWFTSDLHFGHTSILYFHPKRRVEVGITLEELQEDRALAIAKHDEWLINLWNSTVKREDTVYFLGDFSFANKENTEKILQKLKGKKHLILGNHDKSLNGLERYFESVSQIKEAKFSNNQFKFIDPKETFCIEMCHYPLLTWNRRPHGTVMVHGHAHGMADDLNRVSKELRVDVGFDGTLANHSFVELETLYNYFCEIRDAAGCETFQEYNEWLMKEQKVRL